ncbi:NAD-binding protein [Streptosporangium lutulentum]
MSAPVVGIVGAGSIGLAMAVVFAKAGSRVQVHEPSSEMAAACGPGSTNASGSCSRPAS